MPSDVTQFQPICTHVESMVTSLGLLHGQLLTMQSEDAAILCKRAECLLACARDVHDAMEEHAPARKTGWLVGPRAASFLNTCKVFSVLSNAAKGVWLACKQDLVEFKSECLRVALARMHRRLNDAAWTVNEDMLLMKQAPLDGPRHETISVPGRTIQAARRRLDRLRQAMPTELTFLLLGHPRAQAAAHAVHEKARARDVICSLHSHLSKKRVALETLSSLTTRMLKAKGVSRSNRRRVHEVARRIVVTPHPWLLCNCELPPIQLQHDEWTDLSMSAEEEEVCASHFSHPNQCRRLSRHPHPPTRRQVYKQTIFREETFISKRPPLPPDSHVDFISRRVTIPHEWPLSLPADRFILESKPAWQADAPLASWHCGGNCSCSNFQDSKAHYLVGDVTASTTIGTLTTHIAVWLRKRPELRSLGHVLNQSGCTVRMLLLEDGPAPDNSSVPAMPVMRVLAPTSTAKEVGLFNNRDRIFITVDELSPFSPPLSSLHSCFESQGDPCPPSPPSSPPSSPPWPPSSPPWPPWLPSMACEAPLPAVPPDSPQLTSLLLPEPSPSLYQTCSKQLSGLWKSLPSAKECCVAIATLSFQPVSPRSCPPPSPPCSPAAEGTGAAGPAPPLAAPCCGALQQQRFLAAHAAYVQRRNANRPKREEHITLLNNLLAERQRGLTSHSDGGPSDPPERSANLNLPDARFDATGGEARIRKAREARRRDHEAAHPVLLQLRHDDVP